MHTHKEFKNTIHSIMRSMLNDFEPEYHRLYPTETAVTEFRDKLLSALNGFNLQTIIDGYDAAIEFNLDKMPSISDIARGCVLVYDESTEQAKEPPKNDADGPNPENSTDGYTSITDALKNHPLKLIQEAFKQTSGPENETEEEQLERKTKIIQENEDLITDHKAKGYIQKPIFNGQHNCNFGGCTEPGTRSSGTVGGGMFYCSKHIIMYA